MEHVVFYPAADGTPAFERVSSLEAAVGFVERLRNSENITEFAVHELTPVPVSLRAYYHVEIASPAGSRPTEVPDEDRSADWVAEAAIVEPAAVVPAPVMAAPSGPFAEAPPVTSQEDFAEAPDEEPAEEADPASVANAEIVPVPAGRRSMGFFTR
jgi:hypothetical protein